MKKKLVTVLVLVFTMIYFSSMCFYPVVIATSLQELQEKQNELQNQIQDASGELEQVQSELTETLQQIQSLTLTIEQTEDEITGLNSKMQNLQTSITAEEAKLQVAQMDYNKQETMLENRLVAMYEAGETNYLDVLLGSNSISDFISNYYLIAEVVNYDTELLNDIEVQKKNIENTKTLLETQKKEYAQARKDQEKKSILLKNTMTVKNSYMGKLTQAELEIQNQIDTYYQDVREVENQILAIVAQSGGEYIGGVLAWPVPGYSRITSPFGMRVHPITGVYKLHTGMDVGAPIGANFVAANSGIVVKAEYNRAYGNMVMINHGGGIMTLYAHGSEILVQVGQQVLRGDPVLKVGSTGYSTGPHAHFEVRVNGVYQNPVDYFTKTPAELNNQEESKEEETQTN